MVLLEIIFNAREESDPAITDNNKIVESWSSSWGSSKKDIKNEISSPENIFLEKITECDARIFIKLIALTWY